MYVAMLFDILGQLMNVCLAAWAYMKEKSISTFDLVFLNGAIVRDIIVY